MGARKYFGTDGIRGRIGTGGLHPEKILKLGWSIGMALQERGSRAKVLLGKDTRVSGYLVESALEAGLSAAGANVVLLGPLPTPGIAHLTETLRADAGVVISASHNSYEDNGIKIFSANGTKISDAVEELIESYLERPMECVEPKYLGKAQRMEDGVGRYAQFCKFTFPTEYDLGKFKIVLDCANGATYNVAPTVFSELNAEVVTIGASPDGFNINADVGSTKPGLLQDIVLSTKADVGLAFDGDGDRLIMVDHTGTIVDGDDILYVLSHSKDMQCEDTGVVGTVMTNLALEQSFKERNIPFMRTSVGDRHVLEELQNRDWFLGGEPSGHILDLHYVTTGDGIVTGLQVLAVMCQTGLSLHELCKGLVKKPQLLLNVPLLCKINLDDYPVIAAAVRQVEAEMQDSGRVLLRVSGTELCVRIMVEATSDAMAQKYANQLAEVVKQEIGAKVDT